MFDYSTMQNKLDHNGANLSSIAVFLTAYNGEDWVASQVSSIFNQEEMYLHLFISVDLSTDGTYEWCKTLEKEHANVTVLEYGERFGGAAKNFFRLIKEVNFSKFDYIAFADQDDVWFSDKLSHGIRQMNINYAEAYSANIIAFWPDGREKLIDKSQSQREFDYLFEAAGPGCTYIFTNKAASLIKHYLTRFPELNQFVLHDWLSYAILRHNKYKWFIDPIPKMKYRQHDSNQVGANVSLKGIIYRLHYIVSGQAFDSINLLVNVLNIPDIQLSSRKGILKLAFKAGKLRRRRVEQLFAFIVLFLYAIKGPNKK